MALLACFFTGFAPQTLAVFLTGATVVGMGLLGRDTDLGFLLPVLGGALVLLLYGGWAGENAPAPNLLSWGLCALVLAGGVLTASLTGAADWAGAIKDQVRSTLHAARYETTDTVLPEGDFRQTPAAPDPKPGLLVTMSHPQGMYLRGFAGCTFEEDVWKPMDTERLGENRALLYWLNQGVFPLNAQFSVASGPLSPETGTVTIENIGACGENLYIPLGLTGGEWLDGENLNPDTLSAGGNRVYHYTVVDADAQAISRTLEHLQTSDDVQVLEYRKAESAYRDFVYDNYLQVPEAVAELLGDRWNAIAALYGARDNLTLRQAQECALIFLESCFSGESDREQTLPLEKAQGTSYQYATVAVLTLRYFGIPARYAEGYIISEEMAVGKAGKTLNVTGSCAGGWPEVYQDGIGWIPMSLAPGFGEMLREEPDSGQGQEASQEETEETETQETGDPSREERDPIGGTVTALTRGSLRGLFLGLLVLALILLLLVGRRRYLRRKKEAKFRQELGAEAIGWLFADAAGLLEAMGLSRGNGSMRQLCGAAGEWFGEDYARHLAEMIQCNEESLFSSRTMTDRQWQEMMAFHQATIVCLRSATKWYRRLWMKWIRCLY